MAVNMTVESGTIDVGAWWVSIGRGNGTSGLASTLTMNGGTLNAAQGSMGYNANVGGYYAQPTLNLNGASLFNMTNWLYVGESLGSHAYVNIAENSTLQTGTFFSDGRGGEGIVTVSGHGALTVGTDLIVGENGGSSGSLAVEDSATVTAHNLLVASLNTGTTGTVTQTGGTVTLNAGGVLRLGGVGAGTGTYNLHGGTLTTPWVEINSGSIIDVDGGTADLEGGTIVANDAVANLRSGTVMNIGQLQNGAGVPLALYKDVAGTVVLDGVNSYTGGTWVSKGTLEVAGVTALPASGDLMIGGTGIVTLGQMPVISAPGRRPFDAGGDQGRTGARHDGAPGGRSDGRRGRWPASAEVVIPVGARTSPRSTEN